MDKNELRVVYGLVDFGEEREAARGSFEYIMDDISDIKSRYVTLGFHLDEFERCQYYKDFGFVTFEEFCEKNIPLDLSTVSRCISVWQRFCAIDKSSGYVSKKMWLDDKYKDFNYSQLVEMYSLPTPVINLMKPEMTVRQMRDVKKFCKQVKVFDDSGTAKVREFINNGYGSVAEQKLLATSQVKNDVLDMKKFPNMHGIVLQNQVKKVEPVKFMVLEVFDKNGKPIHEFNNIWVDVLGIDNKHIVIRMLNALKDDEESVI